MERMLPNRVKIRRGRVYPQSNVNPYPSSVFSKEETPDFPLVDINKLEDFELGYATDTNYLYIKNGAKVYPIGVEGENYWLRDDDKLQSLWESFQSGSGIEFSSEPIAIAGGGTSAKTAAGARKNLNIIGVNQLPGTVQADTPAYWIQMGPATAAVPLSKLQQQPEVKGLLVNIVSDETMVRQFFYHGDQSGKVSTRFSNDGITWNNENRIWDSLITSQEAEEIKQSLNKTNENLLNAVKEHKVLYNLSTSRTEYLPIEGSEWSVSPPIDPGEYFIWTKTDTTYINPDLPVVSSAPVCLAGTDGREGASAIHLYIESSEGTVFKNSAITTILQVKIFYKGVIIQTLEELWEYFGTTAHLEWSWRKDEDESYGIINNSDPRISENGFKLSLSPQDVKSRVNFICNLVY